MNYYTLIEDYAELMLDVFNQNNRHCNDCNHDWVQEQ
jgi:hypothetical protein